MTEDSLRWCKEKKEPFFYAKLDAKTFKFALCLVCKDGKTFYGRDDVSHWITQHRKTACMNCFESVRGCFGLEPLEAPTEGAPAPVAPRVYIEPTLVVSKDILAKMCAAFEVDKEIAMKGVDAILTSVLNMKTFQKKREKREALTAANEIVLETNAPPTQQQETPAKKEQRKQGEEYLDSLLFRINRIEEEGDELTPHDVGREYYDDDLKLEEWLAHNEHEALATLFQRYKQYVDEDCGLEELVSCGEASRTNA